MAVEKLLLSPPSATTRRPSGPQVRTARHCLGVDLWRNSVLFGMPSRGSQRAARAQEPPSAGKEGLAHS